jgi:hypothetical protein
MSIEPMDHLAAMYVIDEAQGHKKPINEWAC